MYYELKIRNSDHIEIKAKLTNRVDPRLIKSRLIAFLFLFRSLIS